MSPLLLALLASLASAAPAAAPACRPQVAAKRAGLSFPSGASIRVDVVDTPATREVGLMCRRRLPKE